MKQGIRFYMNYGSIEDFDPVNSFKETEHEYEVEVFHTYYVKKNEVLRYEYYPLCDKHECEKSDKYKCNECELEKE